jgi:polyphosphate kinase 2
MTQFNSLENPEVASDAYDSPETLGQLLQLQAELVKMQHSLHKGLKRLAIIFEGRDSAGKSGAVARFIRHLNPRHYRAVALPKPSDVQMGQWFFQRYIEKLPNAGEIVFFDRSWYNRALVEPVLGFCTQEQYERFLTEVPQVEKMLVDDGIQIIKLWFSIEMDVQAERLKARKRSILTSWKLSTVDRQAQMKWNDYTKYKKVMFKATHTDHCPWAIVEGNDKEKARIEAIRHVLSKVEYEDKNHDLVNNIAYPNVIIDPVIE